ncbi:MAG: DUF4214 domain-containing protein, partial [Xenococcaceae cyanobacterium]
MTSFDGTNTLYIDITGLGNDLSFGDPFPVVDNDLFGLDNQNNSYSNGLFWNNLENSHQSNISINGNALSETIRDRVNTSISNNNSITLEVTNTLDTSIIDESDGLSLGEALQIVGNDPENNYLIEIPGGSSYNATLTEDIEFVQTIAFRGIGNGIADVDINRAEQSVAQLNIGSGSTIILNLDSTNNNSDALELTSETAQIAYVAYYGRPADLSGLTFWQDALSTNEVSYAPRRGDILTGSARDIYERIVNDFGNSAEAERIFGGLSNRERVDRVYQFVFNREADVVGSNYWTEQIDNGNVTLVNFALEVALGAQGDDIVTL